MTDANYDPVKDFAPITLMFRLTNVLFVHPSLPVKSVSELIALAKARPGDLNFAHSGVGVSSHLAGELFKSMAGVNIVPISYGSTAKGAAMTALLSGEVQITFGGAEFAEYIKSGRLRALAVTSLKPSALYPNLPTISATLRGYSSGSTYGFFAPGRTPGAVIKRLNEEAVRFLNTTEAKERFLKFGLETVASSPEEFAAAIKADMATTGKMIKDLGIRAQ
jgi:tripartite-type tricarboxylate transporter receptor subunit TctC